MSVYIPKQKDNAVRNLWSHLSWKCASRIDGELCDGTLNPQFDEKMRIHHICDKCGADMPDIAISVGVETLADRITDAQNEGIAIDLNNCQWKYVHRQTGLVYHYRVVRYKLHKEIAIQLSRSLPAY